MQTVPLNQAVVTLTGGVLVSVLRWVGLTGGCATFFVALLFSHPLPARRLWQVRVTGLTAPPFASTFPISFKSCGWTNLRFHVLCSLPSRRSWP